MSVHLIFKTFLIAIAVFCINLSGFAQTDDNNKKKGATDVEKVKVGFITKGLNLDKQEAEKFWPVYNKHQKRLKDNHSKKQKSNMSADDKMKLEEEQLKIKKEKLKDLKTVLPNEKVSEYYKLEEDFKKELLKKLKNNN